MKLSGIRPRIESTIVKKVYSNELKRYNNSDRIGATKAREKILEEVPNWLKKAFQDIVGIKTNKK